MIKRNFRYVTRCSKPALRSICLLDPKSLSERFTHVTVDLWKQELTAATADGNRYTLSFYDIYDKGNPEADPDFMNVSICPKAVSIIFGTFRLSAQEIINLWLDRRHR